MATFVWVHGAWHGGWFWSEFEERLQEMEHKTHAPTLTGLGERSHLLQKDITSNLHVTDIVNTFKWREIISQYHAIGVVSGAYMLRQGRWKYIEYTGFEPKLFDLSQDPEELTNVAANHPDIVKGLAESIRTHVVPETVEVDALAAQDKLIESHDGIKAALDVRRMGGGTPPPNA